jgi:DNA-binding protein HU-beta
MNNKEFIAELSSEMGMNAQETQKMMRDFIEELSCSFDASKDVSLHGFGVFELKNRKERIIMNPATGKKMLVPPKLSLSFKLSETFKNKIKEG